MHQATTSATSSWIDHGAMPTMDVIPRYHASLRPGAIAVTFEGRETDWQTLDKHARQVANALIAAGCKPGDRIAAACKNSDSLFDLMFGAAKAGVVLAPIVWRLAVPEIAQVVQDCEAALLFLGDEQIERAADLQAALPNTRLITLEAAAPGLTRFSEWRDAASDAEPGVSITPDDVVIQLYTSGTTGKPKGVMLNHRNLLEGRRAAMDTPMAWNEWQEGDVNLVALPNGHIGGIGWALVGFYNGATTIVQREFIPADVLAAVEHHRVTKLFAVPTALQMLLMQPRVREIDYSRLRNILYGAAPIALDLLRECTEVFGCGFCQQYGMTETTGTIVYLPPEDHDAAGNPRMRAAGLPMPGVEIRIVDDKGAVLPAGETGEIETRSIANMVGYWRQPDATAATVSAEGWLRTGDAGYLDADGYLYIQDRIKDMICSGAENIYPAEVESAIYGHPAIQEIAVVGVPDDKWGEAVKAIIVLKPGASASAEDIISFARTRIAGFKVPKSVDFIEALPRNATGKILRRALREPYWAGRDRQVN